MIISRGRRYIFVHIPKTGGTAMALALEARAMADDILIGDTPKARKRRGRVKSLTARGRLWKHATLADIDGIVSPAEFDDFLIFTLVRNPWDRMVSYYHWLRTQSFDHPAVGLAQSLDFPAFLRDGSVQTSMSAAPAARYVTDAQGQERKTLFLRLEHLAEDLVPLQAHLGFALDMPHANQSDRAADYRGYYSDEEAAIVSRICARDIERFGYRF
ncbi:sulfotransferase family 2 domain-containing protein [Marinovum sp. 2_MG-2023]|uniref:sulfotransferase family 2 domain-containing protein n=1 Tax=unclassified Marinovum TaxID=2647166 RepID=UPI0026E2B517|nr:MULTISPECIES: sulfotransferase family 2 domain-containing protein [unclassified Marinovum]MDO6728666.1 sulfotransferase family 2 domain-containing protein [Marinovum sp. 2_MG-2023]MDO6777918.1 sulfotransferase family 2 domain-containing protein [Marinovum sp. 1_MG-2023]